MCSFFRLTIIDVFSVWSITSSVSYRVLDLGLPDLIRAYWEVGAQGKPAVHRNSGTRSLSRDSKVPLTKYANGLSLGAQATIFENLTGASSSSFLRLSTPMVEGGEDLPITLSLPLVPHSPTLQELPNVAHISDTTRANHL